jgi:hypothetical protein
VLPKGLGKLTTFIRLIGVWNPLRAGLWHSALTAMGNQEIKQTFQIRALRCHDAYVFMMTLRSDMNLLLSHYPSNENENHL